jgi:hypothetical protein
LAPFITFLVFVIVFFVAIPTPLVLFLLDDVRLLRVVVFRVDDVDDTVRDAAVDEGFALSRFTVLLLPEVDFVGGLLVTELGLLFGVVLVLRVTRVTGVVVVVSAVAE